MSYSQFEELEAISRFSGPSDNETRAALQYGRRVREVFNQSQYELLSVPEQIAIVSAVTSDVFDALPPG